MDVKMSKFVFDITDYGAIPDGATLATEAIQNAMDDAAKVSGIVQIPAGHWACGYVHVPAGIEIRGTYTWNWSRDHDKGLAGTIIEFHGDEDAKCMFDMTDAAGSTLNGLALDGQERGKRVHGVLVDHDGYQEKEDGLRFENVKICFFSGDSVCLRYVRGFTVRHSMLCFSWGWSLSVIGKDGYVIDNWLSGSLSTGNFGLLGDASDIFVTANRIEDPYRDGYDMNLYAPEEDGPHLGCRNITIANNYLCGSHTNGISAAATDGAVIESLMIVGNVFDSSGYRPQHETRGHIYLEGCRNALVSQNALFTKRGFWDPNSPINTSYGIVLRNDTNLFVTENALNDCAEIAAVSDLGGHKGDYAVTDNIGREVCHPDGYMFPYWNWPHHPEEKRDEVALALTDL